MICCKLHLESSLKRILNSKLSHFFSETLFQACLSSIEDLRVFSTISSRESHSQKCFVIYNIRQVHQVQSISPATHYSEILNSSSTVELHVAVSKTFCVISLITIRFVEIASAVSPM